jgi:CDP-diacylglycerol--serine O-phosphatidyltransferase
VLPNLITLCGVFCGFNALRLVAKDMPTADDVYKAALLLIFAMFFDLMDGRVARMTRTQSAFGLQLDSLADIVSFGVAPSLLVYKWVLYRAPLPGIFAAFMFVACASVRLARFNVLSSSPTGGPTKPGKYIIGLPTPPATGILVSLRSPTVRQASQTVSVIVLAVVLAPAGLSQLAPAEWIKAIVDIVDQVGLVAAGIVVAVLLAAIDAAIVVAGVRRFNRGRLIAA